MSVFLGARTLSWPTLCLLAIAGLLAAAASSPEASLRDRLLWISIGLIAQVALTAVYVLGAKAGATRSRLAVLAVVVLGALARALSLAGSWPPWGLPIRSLPDSGSSRPR